MIPVLCSDLNEHVYYDVFKCHHARQVRPLETVNSTLINQPTILFPTRREQCLIIYTRNTKGRENVGINPTRAADPPPRR